MKVSTCLLNNKQAVATPEQCAKQNDFTPLLKRNASKEISYKTRQRYIT